MTGSSDKNKPSSKAQTLPVVVIGAGPAGLTAAHELRRLAAPVRVIEHSKLVGGISRTENYKGYRFDMGGHRFFTKSSWVRGFWQHILGEQFLLRPRLSRIYYKQRFFYYPPQNGQYPSRSWRY